MDSLEKKYIGYLIASPEGDAEVQHIHADEVMCKFLIELGFNDFVERYKLIEKWYA